MVKLRPNNKLYTFSLSTGKFGIISPHKVYSVVENGFVKYRQKNGNQDLLISMSLNIKKATAHFLTEWQYLRKQGKV